MSTITTGSDFSGVGAFDYAIERVSKARRFEHKRIYACDMDKFARITYTHNHGEPDYYPENVYDREIPEESLDVYMTSPPCQSFSLAGKRKGKDSDNGILFFNSHEFIQKNKPRYFIFENVKGLLSDDGGRTFQEWTMMLGGKSVNGATNFFPHEDAVPYHIYHQVLNSKEHGVPQNRERVFIVGIRDEVDNNFVFPNKEPLLIKLKDVLESEVEGKYFLTDTNVEKLIIYDKRNKEKGNGFGTKFHDTEKDVMSALKVGGGGCDDLIKVSKEVRTEESKAKRRETGTNDFRGKKLEFREQDHMNAITTGLTNDHFVKVKSATKAGFEKAKEGDSINFSVPGSETRRGRVGKEVAQTLDTSCNQAVFVPNESKQKDGVIVAGTLKGGKWDKTHEQSGRVYDPEGIGATVHTMGGGNQEPKVCVPVLTPDRIEKRQNGRRFKEDGEEMFTLTTQDKHVVFDGFRIRKLTPRECFRLQDFPESFDFSVVSNSQAYKQAGNSITVRVLEKILMNINL